MKEVVLINDTLLYIIKDAERYDRFYLSPGFIVTLSYRVRRLRKFGSVWYRLLLPIDVLLGIVKWMVSDTTIPSSVPVGPGLCLLHPNGIIINSKTKCIGTNVAIYQQVTIGEWRSFSPSVGNNCAIFGGAKIVGGVVIGDNSIIGANVVVSKDIPENSSVSLPEPIIRIREVK